MYCYNMCIFNLCTTTNNMVTDAYMDYYAAVIGAGATGYFHIHLNQMR